ncbi:uncharacterized protein [Typha angustifolia]|uniref:uncharacterized protein n=1 Tax=Typha angustifolia TaxID=59011 RepID=UPI003C2AF0CF
MCNPKIKSAHSVAQIDGRPVLQPACNRIAALESRQPPKKCAQKPVAILDHLEAKIPARTTQNMKHDELVVALKPAPAAVRENPKRTIASPLLSAKKEKASLMQAQRKMKTAHYGRSATSKLQGKVVPLDSSIDGVIINRQEEKRCSFITPNSDPLYVAYHDEEWGVPVHDDKMLFELLVLTSAQVGSDWTSILKKRNNIRAAFAGFDAEKVAKFTERQMASASVECGLDLGRVRAVVDNANRILEVRRDFGSFDQYVWGFVNHKALVTDYKFGRKIPAKTSKSDAISKDMVRRSFRLVGPTVVHSFMQAAGLTNDHLVSCHRHGHCSFFSTTAATTIY